MFYYLFLSKKIHISKPRWQISIEEWIIKYFWYICCHKSIKHQKLSLCVSNLSKCIYFNHFHFTMKSLCAAFIFKIKLSLSCRWWLPLFFKSESWMPGGEVVQCSLSLRMFVCFVCPCSNVLQWFMHTVRDKWLESWQQLRNSRWRPVYHCCLPLQGQDEKDGILEVTYVVYLIDFGLMKAKVGGVRGDRIKEKF